MKRTFLAFFLVLLPSCESDGSTDDPGPDDDLRRLAGLAGANCSVLQRCCQASGFSTSPLGACETGVFERDDLKELVKQGKVGVDPVRTRECVAAFDRIRCAKPDLAALEVCNEVLVGTVPEGGACSTVNECAKDGAVVCLFPDNRPNVGVCRGYPVAGSGEPCHDTVEDGEVHSITGAPPPTLARCRRKDGLTCDRAAGVCRPLDKQGSACMSVDSCPVGLACRETCQPPAADGAPCRLNGECAGDRCTAGACTSNHFDARTCGAN